MRNYNKRKSERANYKLTYNPTSGLYTVQNGEVVEVAVRGVISAITDKARYIVSENGIRIPLLHALYEKASGERIPIQHFVVPTDPAYFTADEVPFSALRLVQKTEFKRVFDPRAKREATIHDGYVLIFPRDSVRKLDDPGVTWAEIQEEAVLAPVEELTQAIKASATLRRRQRRREVARRKHVDITKLGKYLNETFEFVGKGEFRYKRAVGINKTAGDSAGWTLKSFGDVPERRMLSVKGKSFRAVDVLYCMTRVPFNPEKYFVRSKTGDYVTFEPEDLELVEKEGSDEQ